MIANRLFIKLAPLSLLLISLLTARSVTSVAQGDETSVHVWVEDSLRHVRPSTPPGTLREVELDAARNEVESCQIVVSSNRKLEGVTASSSDLVSTSGDRIPYSSITIYRQEFVYIRNPSPYSAEPPGWWPDALVPLLNPYNGEPVSSMRFDRQEEGGQVGYRLSGGRFGGTGFTVWPGKNQPLWVDVAIGKGVPPGNYKGHLSVNLGAAETVHIPISLTVWNFLLPDGSPLPTQFGNLEGVAARHGLIEDSPQAIRIEERYAAALEAHRLNAPIPRALYPAIRRNGTIDASRTHEALKRYMGAHQTGPFRIPTFPVPKFEGKGRKILERYLQSYYQYLKANGWETGAYYFPISEPNSKENYDRVRFYAKLLHDIEPRIRLLCTEQPYTQDSAWGDLAGSVDIWCPLFAFFDQTSASLARERGDSVWIYTALCQKAAPYHPQFAQIGGKPSLFWQIDFPLLNFRLPLWLSWQYEIQGLLYWSTVHWSDPERDVWTDPGFRNRYNGEGYFLYPGVDAGIQGPVPSLRLKALRDGLEDYAYLKLLAKLGEGDFAAKEGSKVAESWWKWNKDPAGLRVARLGLAQRIIEKQSLSVHH